MIPLSSFYWKLGQGICNDLLATWVVNHIQVITLQCQQHPPQSLRGCQDGFSSDYSFQWFVISFYSIFLAIDVLVKLLASEYYGQALQHQCYIYFLALESDLDAEVTGRPSCSTSPLASHILPLALLHHRMSASGLH